MDYCHPQRRNVLELLSTWRVTIETKENLTEDDRELIMQLSPAYQKWREDTLQEGRQECKRQMVENLLKARFGAVDEPLSRAIGPMIQLPLEELARVLLQSSREELLAAFSIRD